MKKYVIPGGISNEPVFYYSMSYYDLVLGSISILLMIEVPLIRLTSFFVVMKPVGYTYIYIYIDRYIYIYI